MQLSYVDIKNFRSIKSVQLQLFPRCRALIGINESGKTNILRALALLDRNRDIDPTDVREPHTDEGPVDESVIRFVFDLDAGDRRAIQQRIDIADGKLSKLPLVTEGSTSLTLGEMLGLINTALYRVFIKDKTRGGSYWLMPEDRVVTDGWLRPIRPITASQIVSINGSTHALADVKIIHKSLLDEYNSELWEPLTITTLNNAVGSAIVAHVDSNLPSCVFWSYADEQLLPASVELSEFRAKPNQFEPLEQMFNLSGIDDIESAISEAEKRSHGLKNLLNRVASAATQHLHHVWNEYKGLDIRLAPNGTRIDVSIKDRYNDFDFAKRSDGFKRFISFLFLVSAKAKTGELNDVLLLHDEPETGLHPSGAKHLLKEMIEVSKVNYVVYSTHSIFMIDRENIGRHYIVTKESELTRISEANRSNFSEEEVLYQALGFSAFDLLKRKNILFEGWRDKRFLEVALKNAGLISKAKAAKLHDVGICFVMGVKDASKVCSTLDLGNLEWIVVSDSDAPALEAKKRFESQSKAWQGKWLTYTELSGSPIETVEDFFEVKEFSKVANKILREEAMPEIASYSEAGRLAAISKHVAAHGGDADRKKRILEKIKTRLFDNLKPKHVRKEYSKVLDSLLQAFTTQRNDLG